MYVHGHDQSEIYNSHLHTKKYYIEYYLGYDTSGCDILLYECHRGCGGCITKMVLVKLYMQNSGCWPVF